MKALAAWVDSLPQKLKRVTSGGDFIPQIDGLRFIAIASVVFGHVAIYTCGKLTELKHLDTSGNAWVRYGDHFAGGVELFFAISGFVIALPFFRSLGEKPRPPSLRAYFMRRITRLEPPFFLAIMMTFLAFVFWRHQAIQPWLSHLFATLAYLHGPIFGTKSPIAFITWSLEIEIQFYLLAPLLLSVAHFRETRTRILILLALAAACLVSQTFLLPSLPLLWAFLPIYLPFFLAGVVAADFSCRSNFWKSESSILWDAAAILGLGCIFSWTLKSGVGRSFMAFGDLLVLIAAFRGKFFKRWLAHRWITSIGGMCYSIYLLHEPLVYFFGKFTMLFFVPHTISLNVFIQAALILLPVLLSSTLFFLLIEKPCMQRKWPQQLWFKLMRLALRKLGSSTQSTF